MKEENDREAMSESRRRDFNTAIAASGQKGIVKLEWPGCHPEKKVIRWRPMSSHIELQKLGQRAVARKPILQVICVKLGIFRRRAKPATIECWRRCETHGREMAVHIAYRQLRRPHCGCHHQAVPLVIVHAAGFLNLRFDVEVGNLLEDITETVEFVDAVRHVAERLKCCDEVGQETEVCAGGCGVCDDVAESHCEWGERRV